MRRLLRSAFLLLVVATMFAPLPMGESAVAPLPICCLSQGEHHCMGQMVGGPDSPGFSAASKCPYSPLALAAMHGPDLAPTVGAQAIVADLNACTLNPVERRISELLAMLDQMPDVLVVFNHPLWNQSCTGEGRDSEVLDRFLRQTADFLHAFEFNATRSTKENKRVAQLAQRWERPVVSGGDRHGCEPSGALNLTRCETFSEFVDEIRRERRSHVLVMPQYAEPMVIRMTRTLLDVIREYPEYPEGARRWDNRIFHPDAVNGTDRPISTLWKAPPAYVERTFACIRILESAAVQRVLRRMYGGGVSAPAPAEISPEAVS